MNPEKKSPLDIATVAWRRGEGGGVIIVSRHPSISRLLCLTLKAFVLANPAEILLHVRLDLKLLNQNYLRLKIKCVKFNCLNKLSPKFLSFFVLAMNVYLQYI